MNAKRTNGKLVRSFTVMAMTSACFLGLAATSARAEFGSTPVMIKFTHKENGRIVSSASARIYDSQTRRWFTANSSIVGGYWSVKLSPGWYEVGAKRPDGPSKFSPPFYVGNRSIVVPVELEGQKRAFNLGQAGPPPRQVRSWVGWGNNEVVEYREIGNGQWQEYLDGRATYQFRQVYDGNYVEIRDNRPGHVATIRLYSDHSELTMPQQGLFSVRCSGKWSR